MPSPSDQLGVVELPCGPPEAARWYRRQDAIRAGSPRKEQRDDLAYVVQAARGQVERPTVCTTLPAIPGAAVVEDRCALLLYQVAVVRHNGLRSAPVV